MTPTYTKKGTSGEWSEPVPYHLEVTPGFRFYGGVFVWHERQVVLGVTALWVGEAIEKARVLLGADRLIPHNCGPLLGIGEVVRDG
jgi:hypothetical protein